MKPFSVIFILILLISGCGADRSCPRISQDIVDYFPYTEGESIVFISGEQEQRLSIKEVYAVERDRGFFDECGCYTVLSITFQFDVVEIDMFFGFTTKPDVANPSDSRFVINNNRFQFTRYEEELSIGGVDFLDVYRFEILDEDGTSTSEILISDEYGIFSISLNDQTWIIKDASKRSLEVTDLEIEKEAC